MSLNLATILRQAAEDYPDRAAIFIGSKEVSYATLDALARGFAGGLKRLGLRPGQKLAIMVPNVPHFTVGYFGGLYAGQVLVPLNVLLTADEVAYHLADSDATALLVWEGFLEPAKAGFAQVDKCRHLIVAKADLADTSCPAGTENMTALIGSAEPVADMAFTNPDDTAVVLYTSGTTGRPKGAELTHFNLYYNSEYAVRRLSSLTSDDVVLCALPLFHIFGQTVLQNGTMHVGASLIMMPRFEPVEAMRLIQEHKVTSFAGVPTMYFGILNHPAADEYDLSSLKYCYSGGSSMPVDVMAAFDKKYHVNILEGYGLSETSPVACFNVSHLPKKPGSVGIPIKGVQFKLVDDEGRTILETNTPGEIWMKGHNVMKGYYGRPEATKEAITDGGWFHTGDIATRDEDGYYFIIDRKKDMIIRGGYNVYPREVEECLYSHPAIAEAAVIGVPSRSHGEEVKAVVALKPEKSVSAEKLISYCKERLAAYKYPRIVEMRESLPKGSTGKILKRELRGPT